MFEEVGELDPKGLRYKLKDAGPLHARTSGGAAIARTETATFGGSRAAGLRRAANAKGKLVRALVPRTPIPPLNTGLDSRLGIPLNHVTEGAKRAIQTV